MKFDGFLNKLFDLGFGFADGDAAGKVGNIGPPAFITLFYYDHVSHNYFLRPACFKTLFKVPGGMSILSFPAIVTVPGFAG